MATFQTTDETVVQRCAMAMRAKTEVEESLETPTGPQTVCGFVQSIENIGGTPGRWEIAIVDWY